MKNEEPKQIKCYCGHTTMCDCSPIDEAFGIIYVLETLLDFAGEDNATSISLSTTDAVKIIKLLNQNNMSKQHTAIDWLIQALESDIEVDESNMVTIKMHEHDYITSKVIAKEMEKEQIIDACIYGPFEDLAEQYYTETYE